MFQSILRHCLLQDEPGSPLAGAAYLAAQCRDSLEVVDRTAAAACSPFVSPLVFRAASQDPLKLSRWLAAQASTLTAVERTRHSPASSSEFQQLAYEQLCRQQAALADAEQAITQWSLGSGHLLRAQSPSPKLRTGPDPQTVLPVSSAWQGHVMYP